MRASSKPLRLGSKMEYSRGWINEARTDEQGVIQSVAPFLPGQT